MPGCGRFLFMSYFEKITGILVGFSILFACNPAVKSPVQKIKYTGPTMQSRNVATLYSDSSRLKIKLKANLQYQFENGDAEYPKGIHLTFYDNKQQVSSELQANYAKYDKVRDSYFVRGKVVVDNKAKGEIMKTEELHWNKIKREIYTDKFVTIQTKTDILTGEGLTTNENFYPYKILRPKGVFSVEQ